MELIGCPAPLFGGTAYGFSTLILTNFRLVNMYVSGLNSTSPWTELSNARRESRLDGCERPLQQNLLLPTDKVTFVTCDVVE
jgi:hypothetical protein